MASRITLMRLCLPHGGFFAEQDL
eukprot:COSAG01_NODE_69318_length_261_cov_1.827160_1_plen_23_part_01